MKILLIAIGTRGDVQPFVTLGKALVSRGHDVSIAAAGGFSDMIVAAGLQHFKLPMDFQDLINTPEVKSAMTSFTGKLKMYRWASKLMNEQLDALWAIGLEVAPDLILHHFKGAVAPYLARKLKAVSVPVVLQPGFMPTRDYPQFLIASRSLGGFGNIASHRVILAAMKFGSNMMLKRWRKASNPDLGTWMNPLKSYAPEGAAPRIHAYSSAIVPRPVEWPETEVQTGYLFAEPEPYQAPAPLDEFLKAGPAPVYVGFGSMPGIDEKRVAEAITGAIEKLGMRAMVATGWSGNTEFKTSADIHVLNAVPHSWLFPQVSAVVHHGGSGTTHEGLRWGRPSVICPVFADQPFFGQRVAELGAGPEPVALKNITTQKLTVSIETALSAPAQRNAEKIGIKLRDENGVMRVCDLVERDLNRLGN